MELKSIKNEIRKEYRRLGAWGGNVNNKQEIDALFMSGAISRSEANELNNYNRKLHTKYLQEEASALHQRGF